MADQGREQGKNYEKPKDQTTDETLTGRIQTRDTEYRNEDTANNRQNNTNRLTEICRQNSSQRSNEKCRLKYTGESNIRGGAGGLRHELNNQGEGEHMRASKQ